MRWCGYTYCSVELCGRGGGGLYVLRLVFQQC